MRLEQLSQLITIIDCGSINKAAEKLFLAPSSLSSSIRSLEAELGYEVLQRYKKGVRVTELGVEVYNRAKKICAEVASLKTEDLISPKRDHLIILNNYSVRARDAFLKTYIQCQNRINGILKFKDCTFLQTISEISLGLAQVGLVTIYPQIAAMQTKLIEKHHLSYKKLCDAEIFILLGPENPFYHAENDYIMLGQLKEYDFVTYLDEDSNSFWRELFMGYEYNKLKIFVNSVETITEFICQTQAYTVEVYTPELFAKSPYFRRMRFLRIADFNTECEYGIVMPKQAKLSSLEKTFLAQMERELMFVNAEDI